MKSYILKMPGPSQFRDLTDDDYLELQKILEKQHGRPITIDEAREVGDGLVAVFSILANGRRITPQIVKRGTKKPNFLNRVDLTGASSK